MLRWQTSLALSIMALGFVATSPSAQSQAKSTVDLEQRILLLEKRLLEFEKRERANVEAKQRAAAAKPGGVARGLSQAQPLITGANPPVGDAPSNVPTSEQAEIALPPGMLPVGPGAPTAPKDPAVATAEAAAAKARQIASKPVTDPTKDASTQASFLYSDTVPTLDNQQVELTQQFRYVRNQAFLQTERSGVGTTALRYGIGGGYEFGLRANYYAAERITSNPNSLIKEDVISFSDVGASGSATLWKPASWYPGAAVTLSVSAPLGEAPYTFFPETPQTTIKDPNGLDIVVPRQPAALRLEQLRPVQSRGHWTSGAQMTFFKTFDPLIVFFGGGVEHSFEREFYGYSVQPGLRYNYSMGLSLAMSEHTTLGFQVQGILDDRLKINGRHLTTTDFNEAALARFTVIQRLDKDLYLEPSVTLGLVESTQDLGVGVGVRKRF